MTRSTGIVWSVIAALTAGSGGCGGATEPETPPEPSAVTESPAPTAKDSGGPAPEPENQPEARAPETADEAVRNVLEGIRNNRPAAVWQFLPVKYREDVNSLIHSFAERMDPELWQRGVESLQGVVDLLENRQDLLLARSGPADGENGGRDASNRAAAWQGLVDLLQTFLDSELSDLSALKQLDGGAFLAGTGRQVMQQLAAVSRLHPDDPYRRAVDERLAQVEVTLLSSGRKTATLRLTSPEPSAEPQEVEFVRVDGKWIPKPLADAWQPTIQRLRRRIASMTPERMAQLKQRLLPALDRLDGIVAELQQAGTREEFESLFVRKLLDPFNAAVSARQQPPGQSRGGGPGGPGGGGEAPDGTGTVTVVVDSRLSGDRESWLAEQLRKATDDPGNMTLVGPLYSGEQTRYELAPVRQLEPFISRIDFADVLEASQTDRTVRLRFSGEKFREAQPGDPEAAEPRRPNRR